MEVETETLVAGPLTEELLAQLAAKLIQLHPTWQTVQYLRESYPDIRFILCSEDDMGLKEAYRSYDGFDIFLMAGGFGCACLTETIEQSVGIIVATIEE